MKVIVVGGGKVGYYLTKTLFEHGHKPHLIEKERDACSRAANSLEVPVICGDGSTIDVLESAQTRGADALIAVTGRDQDNLVACQLAKQLFHVQRTVARVNNPKNASVMKQLGVDLPVSSTDNIARLLEHEIDGSPIRQLMALNQGDTSLCELLIPQQYKLDGVRLLELQLPEESIIVSITRDGRLIIPRGNTQILGGDKVLAICSSRFTQELSRKIGLSL